MKRKFKYSITGLSYRYDVRARVLEKLEVQQKEKLMTEPKKYEEFKDIKEGEIWVVIEHWYFQY